MSKKPKVGNGITDNGDGTAVMLCGDKEIIIRYEPLKRGKDE